MLDGITSVAGRGGVWEALARSQVRGLIPRRVAERGKYVNISPPAACPHHLPTLRRVFAHDCVSFARGAEVPQGRSYLPL